LTLKLETSRFGSIDLLEEKIIHVPSGLFGFPGSKRYTLLEHKKGSPFLWLQSVDNGSLAFVLIDPLLVKPDYEIQISPEDMKELELTDAPEGIQTLAIVNITPGEKVKLTANLVGPIVINVRKKLGRQIVLSDEHYSLRHPIPQNGLP
jgi:flagellar assembly factor FliW